jgi:hypothetical protein
MRPGRRRPRQPKRTAAAERRRRRGLHRTIVVKAAGKARRDMGGKAVSATPPHGLRQRFVAVKSAKHAPFGAFAVKSSFPFITMQLRYLKCISTRPAAKIFEKFSPRLSISVGDGRSVCPATGAPRAQPLERPAGRQAAPARLDQVIGQGHARRGRRDRADGCAGKLSSMILWGPPGTGKTSIARPARRCRGHALHGDQRDLFGRGRSEEVFAEAEAMALAGPAHPAVRGRDPPLQPRAAGWLPARGGKRHDHAGRATTENPSFALNAALLSRAQVLILHRLDAAALGELLRRAEEETGLALPLTPPARGRWSPRPTATGASCSTRWKPC